MSMRKSFLTLLASILFLAAAACQDADKTAGASSAEDPSYVVLSKSEFGDRLAKADDYVLVDVRRPEEYEDGHIEGAININFLDPAVFEAQFSKMDTTQTLMIYCRSGSRSRRSAEKLREMGFKKIYDLEGGYLNWQE
jgi:rhodanese-related sulfurtransferase